MNIDNFRRRIMMGIVPMRKWEKLADVTTTEDLQNLVINSGDNGQVLDDYDVLMVSALFQPTSESVKNISLAVSGNAWVDNILRKGAGNVIVLDGAATFYSLGVLFKTPIGIMGNIYEQYNHGSVPDYVGIPSTNTFFSTRLSVNTPASVMDSAICKYEHFDKITYGCYTGKPITAGARVQIWGAKL